MPTKKKTPTQITYTKLRNGNWGLRGPASAIRAGATVTVTKRSGETKRETVGSVFWSDDSTAIASIAKSASAPASDSGYRPQKGIDYCGYPCPVSGRRCTANDPCHDCQ